MNLLILSAVPLLVCFKSFTACVLLRKILAKHFVNKEGKRHHMMAGYSFIKQAGSTQEHVVLNAQSLFPSQEVLS